MGKPIATRVGDVLILLTEKSFTVYAVGPVSKDGPLKEVARWPSCGGQMLTWLSARGRAASDVQLRTAKYRPDSVK